QRLLAQAAADELSEPVRCWETGDPLYQAYHDEEWGRPVQDERGLYERLCLEGFQSGLSWLTILRKRESFRAAFAGFDPDAVARSKLLKKHGFRFVGPTTVYAAMQACGIVNDHIAGCHVRPEVERLQLSALSAL